MQRLNENARDVVSIRAHDLNLGRDEDLVPSPLRAGKPSLKDLPTLCQAPFTSRVRQGAGPFMDKANGRNSGAPRTAEHASRSLQTRLTLRSDAVVQGLAKD